MRGHAAVEVNGESILEFTDVQTGHLRERGGDLLYRAVEAVDDGDDLGAQARREEHDLMNISVTDQRAKDLAPLVLEHRRTLEEIQ